MPSDRFCERRRLITCDDGLLIGIAAERISVLTAVGSGRFPQAIYGTTRSADRSAGRQGEAHDAWTDRRHRPIAAARTSPMRPDRRSPSARRGGMPVCVENVEGASREPV
jgi:hypothetical protein